ncbi:hypothetical protein [Ramlibacter alkalitolerans]|uniref:Uncharacterized protein n=1 Tax=Ramlibacter alkalitolerans TaxID=2039631 RepID=A0ABS1JPP2_9BURK|nr:hypothetical protein [Ramlibacter alkalitolerans]MBL0426222.1 hypothetical protein [Ramlibacter alkalitolerans]
MFASSHYPPLAAEPEAQAPCAPVPEDEGRHSEESRRATAAVLLPRGKPGAWLLLLVACCAFVVVEAIALRLA